jgi:hypothetical protein
LRQTERAGLAMAYGGAVGSTLTVAVIPPAPSILEFLNLGTGSGTTNGGVNECSYTLNLTIQQEGTCHFWG